MPNQLLAFSRQFTGRAFACAILACVATALPPTTYGQDILKLDASRHGGQLKEAFRDLVKDVQHYAVDVEINKRHKVPGTLLDVRRGWIACKASELNEFADKDDTFVCHFAGDATSEAKMLGYDKSLDLVFLKLTNTPDLADVKPVQELLPGQWVVSINRVSEVPLGVGVLGAGPREIESAVGYLGLTVDETPEGLTVSGVMANSGASQAGLKKGDILLKQLDNPARKRGWLAKKLGQIEPGDWFTLLAERDGELLELDVRIGANWDSVIDRQALMNRFGSDVSSRRSGFRTAMQHDTLMHPSDCGGPLVTLDGKLAGINIARAGRTDTYAIPLDAALEAAKKLD